MHLPPIQDGLIPAKDLGDRGEKKHAHVAEGCLSYNDSLTDSHTAECESQHGNFDFEVDINSNRFLGGV